METGFSKFFRSSLRDAEIILRAGQRIISEINILVENSQGSSQIPKSNPQLLNAEIKKKIARHENKKFCQKTAICINCGDSHSGQCSNNSRCINCKGDHPANSLNCPEYIKEKKILELKCEQHLTLGEARRRFRDNKRTSYSAVIQTNTVNLDMQDYLGKKLENMLTSFQAILEKQTTLIFKKQWSLYFLTLARFLKWGNRVTPHCGKKAVGNKSSIRKTRASSESDASNNMDRG
ncbi:uncharacterized protein TNCV_2059161 [Trichonephila clavipes]|nr:uncharacterized protein TNCV_2059161 [Trichonephila clavipes]